MILLIDNYDSFVYNLYQYLGVLDPHIVVKRNDEVSVEEIREMAPTHIILSPGPGRPENAGVCEEVVRELGSEIPILGVCLGHQAIVSALGGKITYANKLMHGKQSQLTIEKPSPLYEGLKGSLPVARYHSLAADEESLPAELRVTARSEDGTIMALEHVEYPLYGVQFHPESILTPGGMRMIRNFLSIDNDRSDQEDEELETKDRQI